MTAGADSPSITIRSADGASVVAHHDGAHVVSWRPAGDGDERLFLSECTVLREGVAIRGGVPVIFPQFAAEGPLPRHGFARTMRWTLAGVDEPASGDASVRFSLVDSEVTRAIWPVSFAATVTVHVGGARLAVSLAVRNTGDASIDFSAALHTYLKVGDVTTVALEGLKGCRFRESGAPGVLRVDDEAVLRPKGELDRVYVDVPRALLLREPDRALGISAAGFPDVVVWNPGAAKAAKLDDVEPGGERRMLCVEAAAVQRRVVVAPGETWTGTQVLDASERSSS